MTTQSESSSPFQDTADNQAPDAPQKFTFRTMQDDLLAAQKIGTPISSVLSDSSLLKEQSRDEMSAETTPKDDSNKKLDSFFNQPVTPKTPSTNGPFADITHSKESMILETPKTQTKNSQPNAFQSKTLKIIVVFLVIGIISLGGYYFWLTRAPQQAPISQQPVVETILPVEEPEEAAPVVITPPIEKYSSTNPNYLTIDLANLSAAEIQTSILTVADEVKRLSSQSPYEFIVVDANNNPISFPIFATASKLNLSPTILSVLDEDFSLFFYNDADNVRFGISAVTSKQTVLTAELQKQEKTLPADLSFMFLGLTPSAKSNLFADALHNGDKIRYLNFDQQETLSLDYSIKDNHFILSTSKNMQRALLDKTSQQSDSPVLQQSQN